MRFAFITTTQPGADERGLPLTASQFAGPALPYPSYLRLDTTLLLHRSLVLKPLARLSAQTMAQVMRQIILAETPRYYRFKFAATAFRPQADRVHYAGRVFDADELCNLVDASLDFFLTANRYAERFEADFADYLGLSRRAAGQLRLVGQPGGADGAHVAEAGRPPPASPATRSSRWRPGSRRRVAPILQNSLVPVFVDVNLGDYTADPERLARGDRTEDPRDHDGAHAGRAVRPRRGARQLAHASTTCGSSRTTATRSARATAAG